MQEAYTWKLEVLEQQKVSMAHGKVSNAGAPMAIPTLPTVRSNIDAAEKSFASTLPN